MLIVLCFCATGKMLAAPLLSSVPRAYLLLSRVLGSFWMFFFCAWLSACHEEKDW
jgi:hypothetical protein